MNLLCMGRTATIDYLLHSLGALPVERNTSAQHEKDALQPKNSVAPVVVDPSHRRRDFQDRRKIAPYI